MWTISDLFSFDSVNQAIYLLGLWIVCQHVYNGCRAFWRFYEKLSEIPAELRNISHKLPGPGLGRGIPLGGYSFPPCIAPCVQKQPAAPSALSLCKEWICWFTSVWTCIHAGLKVSDWISSNLKNADKAPIVEKSTSKAKAAEEKDAESEDESSADSCTCTSSSLPASVPSSPSPREEKETRAPHSSPLAAVSLFGKGNGVDLSVMTDFLAPVVKQCVKSPAFTGEMMQMVPELLACAQSGDPQKMIDVALRNLMKQMGPAKDKKEPGNGGGAAAATATTATTPTTVAPVVVADNKNETTPASPVQGCDVNAIASAVSNAPTPVSSPEKQMGRWDQQQQQVSQCEISTSSSGRCPFVPNNVVCCGSPILSPMRSSTEDRESKA